MNARWLKLSLVAPTLAFLVAMNVFPLLYSVGLSFTDARLGGAEARWVGGDNYARVFGQPQYAAALRTTGLFVFCAVGVELLLGFALALCLRRAFFGKPVVLTLLLVPMMLSPAVVGLLGHQIFNGSYGLLTHLVGSFPWLTRDPWRFVMVVLVDVWMWTPFMMLIALAGLNAIPAHLYEAAAIDRASAFTVFRRITLPLCAPLLGLAVLLRATDALKQFDLVMALTGPNTPGTQTLSALIYQDAIRSQNLGLGSAYAVVVLVVVIAVATLFTRYLDAVAARQGRAAA